MSSFWAAILSSGVPLKFTPPRHLRLTNGALITKNVVNPLARTSIIATRNPSTATSAGEFSIASFIPVKHESSRLNIVLDRGVEWLLTVDGPNPVTLLGHYIDGAGRYYDHRSRVDGAGDRREKRVRDDDNDQGPSDERAKRVRGDASAELEEAGPSNPRAKQKQKADANKFSDHEQDEAGSSNLRAKGTAKVEGSKAKPVRKPSVQVRTSARTLARKGTGGTNADDRA